MKKNISPITHHAVRQPMVFVCRRGRGGILRARRNFVATDATWETGVVNGVGVNPAKVVQWLL